MATCMQYLLDKGKYFEYYLNRTQVSEIITKVLAVLFTDVIWYLSEIYSTINRLLIELES